MTPLEKVAEVLHERKTAWRYMSGPTQNELLAKARAALIALSECELPEEIAQEGGIAGHVMDSIAVDCFRAMLRAIANVPSS